MVLNFYEWNPTLLKASVFDGYGLPIQTPMNSRICFDYELEYYLESSGGIIVDREYMPFHKGEINFRQPGQVVQGVLPYRCYVVCIRLQGTKPPPKDYVFGNAGEAQPLYDVPFLTALGSRIIPQNPAYIERIFREMCALFPQGDSLSLFRSKQLLYELFFSLFRQVQEKGEGFHPKIIQAAEYISAHFCEPICVSELIASAGLSKAYFHKCFLRCTGKTPVELITGLRIDKAQTLLCVTNSPVGEISSACGYDDPVYFAQLFKRHTGFTPTEYRRRQSTGENVENLK